MHFEMSGKRVSDGNPQMVLFHVIPNLFYETYKWIFIFPYWDGEKAAL